MRRDWYILDGHTPVKCIDWADGMRAFENIENCRVARDEFGDIVISTIFLGLDHRLGDGPPLLFETMIFGGEHDGWQERCSTWEGAEAMHEAAVAMVKVGAP